MRVFRSEALIALAVFSCAVGISASVHAQQSGPVKLAPPKTLTAPAQPGGAQAPKKLRDASGALQQGYKAGPSGVSRANLATGGAKGIQVDRLSAVSPDSAGVLSAENGGFGIDMWRGTSMARASRLMGALPARIPSRTLAQVVRRLMLSQAAAPEGIGTPGEMAGLRLERLIAMGDYTGALDLMSVMPRQGRGTALLQAEAELRFLSGENIAACRLVGNEVRTSKKDFWQKALVFCQLLSEQRDKAELGLTLLREVGTEDALFDRIADAMIAGTPAEVEDLGAATPLVLAMIRHAKVSIPTQTIATMAPGALQVTALNGDLPVALRLAAIERLAQSSVSSDGALQKILDAVLGALATQTEEAPAELADPLRRAVDRAKLLMAARQAKVPVAKAEALSQALRSAAADGAFVGAARLYRNELGQIPVGTDLRWFAADAFRASAVNGEWERAEAWVSMVRRSAAMTEEAADIMKSLAPVAQVVRGASKAAVVPVELANLDPERGFLLHVVLAGLGQQVPLSRWERWDGAPTGTFGPMPAAPVWFTLSGLNAAIPSEDQAPAAPQAGSWKAVSAASITPKPAVSDSIAVQALGAPTAGTRSDLKHKAEHLLVMVQAMGARDLTFVHPAVLHEVVRGLVAMGLPQEARALALEVALEAGL